MPWKPRSHRPEANRRHARTTTQRGYGWDWQQLRQNLLRHNPLCKDCESKGIARPATEVHHVTKIKDDAERRLDVENLMPLCGECHDDRTARGE